MENENTPEIEETPQEKGKGRPSTPPSIAKFKKSVSEFKVGRAPLPEWIQYVPGEINLADKTFRPDSFSARFLEVTEDGKAANLVVVGQYRGQITIQKEEVYNIR